MKYGTIDRPPLGDIYRSEYYIERNAKTKNLTMYNDGFLGGIRKNHGNEMTPETYYSNSFST